MNDSLKNGTYSISETCNSTYEPVLLDKEEKVEIIKHVFQMIEFVRKELVAAQNQYNLKVKEKV